MISRATIRAAAALASGLSVLLPAASGDAVTTVPCGYVSVTAAGASDTPFSVPLLRATVYTGLLGAVDGATLTVADNPAWATSQFVKQLPGQPETYFVRVKSGALAGHYFTIVGNTATAVTVDDAGLDLSALAAGNQIEISPYWTLGTLFPASKAGVAFEASPNPVRRATELLCYAPGAGINQAPSLTYYFYNGAWRRFGQSSTVSYDDVVLPPDTFFRIRNKTLATKVTTAGRVLEGAFSTVIAASGSGQQDNLIALPSATEVTLGQCGLVSSGAFAASPNPVRRTDQLLVFPAGLTGYNSVPTETYYYYNGAWRKFGASSTLSYDDAPVFRPGSAAILRKAVATESTSYTWTFSAASL